MQLGFVALAAQLALLSLTIGLSSPALAQRLPDAELLDLEDPVFEEQMGREVVQHEDFLLVTSRGERIPGSCFSGVIRVFKRTGADYELIQKLWMTRDVPCGAWEHGATMETLGPFLFVASPHSQVGSFGRGLVDVYRKTPSGYVLFQSLVPQDPDHRLFGWSMHAHEGDIWISMPDTRVNGAHRGGITRYAFDGTRWVLVETLIPDITGFSSAFRDFGFDGPRLICTESTNRAIVWERSGTGWVVTDEFTKSSASVSVVMVAGDSWLLFGDANIETGSFRAPGKVQAFRWNGSSYDYVQEIRPLNQVTLPSTGDLFGFDLDMDGGRVLIGAPFTTRDGVTFEGATYVFELENGVWVQRERFEPPPSPVAPGQQPGFQFGFSVHMGPDSDFVGMTYFVHSGDFMGGAFVFDRPLGETVCGGQPNSTGASATLGLRGSSVASAGSLRLEAEALPPATPTLLVVGRQTGFTLMLGGGVGDLCIEAQGIARLGLVAADASGSASWQVDTLQIPRPGGGFGIASGETLVFQAWYRDFAPTPTSNLTEARRVDLR